MFSILQHIFRFVLEPLWHNKADRRIEKEIFALIHAVVFEYKYNNNNNNNNFTIYPIQGTNDKN